MKNISSMKILLIALLLSFTCANAEKCPSCMDDGRKAQEAFDMVMPSIAVGMGSALLLVGANHLLGLDKKIDDGWFIIVPMAFASYQLGTGMYHSYRVGVGITGGF